MSLTQAPMRRFSNLLYRRPNLYLAMLLIPPLIWFGAIYLGSLLTLLWQGSTRSTTSPWRSRRT